MKILLLVVVFLYITVLAYFYFTQNSKIFNISEIPSNPPIVLKNAKKISLEVSDDAVLDGVYKKSNQKNLPTIIYFGGNSDDATRFLLYVKNINNFNIVTFNYRGYVQSTGKPSEKNLFSDALKIYDKFAKDSKIILIGRSLGSGVALYLASKREVSGVVLITPYDSIASLAKEKYPFLPIDLILKYKFESVKYVEKIASPISIIEVKGDRTIPNAHTLKLSKKIKNQGEFIVLENTTHGDVLNHPKFEESIKNIIKGIYTYAK